MKNLAKKGFWGVIVVMFLSVTLVGCSSGLSKAELEKQVAASIEETINADNRYGESKSPTKTIRINPYNKFEVEKVVLIKKGENEYTGSATIIGIKSGNSKNDTFTETLTVIADKDSFQWQFE